ncbi:MAG: N-6 DNA methylase, partial [Prevotellaceae bacterium]|nr:N-6 DNA methylase [Prevotellaceae bacterium]
MQHESLIAAIEPQVQTYLAYMATRPNGEEIEYRTPFETLFNTLQIPFLNKTSIVQEDRRSGIEIDGMPDFFVWNDADTLFKSLIGFIECKKPSFNLDKLIESAQIKKYSKTCENIIITNYKRFILLQEGKKQHDITLAADTKTLFDFVTLLQDFYNYKYPYIKTKKSLATALAAQSFYYSVALREYIADKTNATESFYTKFRGLFGEYEKSINYHYELADFCDVYAQSLVYGLLLARLDTDEQLNEQKLNYLENIPDEYRLLHEFLEQGYVSWNLPTEIKIALTNIGKNINLIDTVAITNEFLKINSGKQNIAVYLYEDFLAQYDKFRGTENRKEGGVYYTPSEATDFITRGVNHLIRDKFKLYDGYRDLNIKILDFACGTGTFIHSILEQIIPENPDSLDKSIVKQKVKNDIYGFELLFTPYIIAHTVLTRFLKEKGIVLDTEKNERLGIYLTNTLDISQHSISELLPYLKNEYEKSQSVKDVEEILAIIGNPPYFNGKSREKSDIIDAELQKYKDGLNEKKINLDDLYIKFIRFAERKIEKNGHGIVGIITNNSFLDGVTHRKMREHLYNTFDEIYILNLHGNTRKGDNDKNIFDIMVGVSISFFVKYKKAKTITPKVEQTLNFDKPRKEVAPPKPVFYFSTLDNNLISRAEKLAFLENTGFKTVRWKKIIPSESQYFWFTDKKFSNIKQYKKFWKLTDIFNSYNSGIQTKNDDFVLHYSQKSLEKLADEIRPLYKPEIAAKYNVSDSRDWTIEKAKEDLLTNYNPQEIAYRPFDNRITSLSKISKGFIAYPRYETAKHFEKGNIGLCFSRQLFGEKWQNIFVVDKMAEGCTVSLKSREWTYIAPLYFYNGAKHPEMLQLDFKGEGEKYANFTEKFIKNYIKKLTFNPAPEEILAYIYGVLHSKRYREKYVEFLKTDFPAVPMTTHKETFDKYATLGQKLIDLHLLKTPVDNFYHEVVLHNGKFVRMK